MINSSKPNFPFSLNAGISLSLLFSMHVLLSAKIYKTDHIMIYSRPVFLKLWVATRGWVAGGVKMRNQVAKRLATQLIFSKFLIAPPIPFGLRTTGQGYAYIWKNYLKLPKLQVATEQQHNLNKQSAVQRYAYNYCILCRVTWSCYVSTNSLRKFIQLSL